MTTHVVPSSSLTLLARSVVFDTLAEMIRAAGEERRGVGVLVVRLGNLRNVTLGRGYAAGEILLAEAGNRIASIARRRDRLARVGDQDFVLLLPGILGSGQILLCANKLLRAVSEPMQIGEDVVPLHVTIGAAACPEHGCVPESLLHAAEQAAAHAEERMVSLEIFAPAPTDAPAADWQIEALFDRGFERGEFELHYQAKLDLASGRTVGAEALSRWVSGELGHISPAVFIPVAERSGHIERLTWSTINAALEQNAAWRAAGRDYTVAVNLSPLCLGSSDLTGRVRNALALWNVPATCLTLEVTEGAIMRDPASSFAILRAVRELGVHVSIDDFGTGHSSLAYFRELPADELKIDKSFVMNILTSGADRHLVQTVIDLAHRFDLSVVAEGIENAETAAVLTEMGCDLGQGYHLAMPVPPRDFGAAARDALNRSSPERRATPTARRS
ncbi:MAG: putative bifunctional diguanylate cyclase/phosphodiesterase [Steroidobacteraceae bacterium]